jgi:hypothetical protein
MIETSFVEKKNSNDVLKELTVVRQSLGIGAVLVLLGVALGYFTHPYFFILALLPAFGLMLTSLVGWCPMVYILERMPWNKA